MSGHIEELGSVIIPAYNAERWIAATLTSALAQTYRALEVVVVDDGSQDTTSAIVETFAVRDPRVHLVRQENQGLAAARNAAIAASKGTLIAPLDADDLWHRGKIAKQVVAMRSGAPRVGLVYSWCSLIDEADRVLALGLRPRYRGQVYVEVLTINFICSASNPLIRRACLSAVGGYGKNVEGCEDLKLYLEIAEKYEFALVPEFLVGYRRTSASMSQDILKMKRSHDKVLAEAKQRHPELSAHLFRQATCVFCYWFGLSGIRNGRIREGLSMMASIARNDPLFPLRSLFRQAAVRAVRRLGRRAGFIEQAVGKPFSELSPRS